MTEFFKATPNALWDLLTNPDKIKLYMYGSMAVSDWEEGSTIDFYIEKDGQNLKVVNGIIIRFEKNKILEHTLFPTLSDIDDITENYLYVRYQLTPENGGCQLKITQGDFDKVAQGEKRYEDSVKGWDSVISIMKKIVE